MCRILAAAGKAPSLRILGMLVKAFLSAAERDELLAPVYGGYSHCDGYGYVVAYWRAGTATPHIEYARHDTLSCRENLSSLRRAASRVLDLASLGDRYIMILHARKASEGEPRGPLHAHPYRVDLLTAQGPSELYMAHNGGMEKKRLAERLGLPADKYTDSHLAVIYLARRITAGAGVADAFRELKEYVKETSAMDTATMLLPGRLYLTGYVRAREEKRYRYYQPFLFRGDCIVGYVSSTVKDYAEQMSVPVEYSEIQGVFVDIDAETLEEHEEKL